MSYSALTLAVCSVCPLLRRHSGIVRMTYKNEFRLSSASFSLGTFYILISIELTFSQDPSQMVN